MEKIPETRDSLLVKIQSRENALAWEEFVEIYRPVVYGIAVSRGLQHADALDLVQTVFISVASSIGRWEKRDNQTRFRNWLLRIAKNATLNALTRRKPDEGLGGNGHSLELADIPVAEVPSEIEIDFEYKRQLYLRAAEEVRARVTSANWMAFELTAVEGVSIELVAEELGKSVGAIYAARSRIMKQLSDLVSKVEEMYE